MNNNNNVVVVVLLVAVVVVVPIAVAAFVSIGIGPTTTRSLQQRPFRFPSSPISMSSPMMTAREENDRGGDRDRDRRPNDDEVDEPTTTTEVHVDETYVLGRQIAFALESSGVEAFVGESESDEAAPSSVLARSLLDRVRRDAVENRGWDQTGADTLYSIAASSEDDEGTAASREWEEYEDWRFEAIIEAVEAVSREWRRDPRDDDGDGDCHPDELEDVAESLIGILNRRDGGGDSKNEHEHDTTALLRFRRRRRPTAVVAVDEDAAEEEEEEEDDDDDERIVRGGSPHIEARSRDGYRDDTPPPPNPPPRPPRFHRHVLRSDDAFL